MEAVIDLLSNEQGGCLVTEDFKEKFCKIIIDHHLCKFHYFSLHSTHLTPKFSLPWGSHSQVGKEW